MVLSKLCKYLGDMRLHWKLVEVFRAAYPNLSCKVKVGEEYRDPFR